MITEHHKISNFSQTTMILQNPNKRLWFPVHAVVSFTFLHLRGLFLTEYFTSALDQLNISTF